MVISGWFIEQTPEVSQSPRWGLNPKALPTFLDNKPKRWSEDEVTPVPCHLGRYRRD